ncbi:hypothetical protein AB0M43_21990 [Longispora sp. NPDC051575]|uniref:hypothetical protein n=1 Tax=Longispora sp. NPDC051575 TaxID=3154943 RepID=UPI0034484260
MRELLLALALAATLLGLAVWRGHRSRTPPAARAVLDPAVRRLVTRAATGGTVRIVVGAPAPDGLSLTFSPVAADEPRVYAGNGALRVYGPPDAATVAAVLLAIRDETGILPHAHFPGTGHGLVRRLVTGGGTAPVTRVVLRRAEPDPRRRPVVHVG